MDEATGSLEKTLSVEPLLAALCESGPLRIGSSANRGLFDWLSVHRLVGIVQNRSPASRLPASQGVVFPGMPNGLWQASGSRLCPVSSEQETGNRLAPEALSRPPGRSPSRPTMPENLRLASAPPRPWDRESGHSPDGCPEKPHCVRHPAANLH